MFQKTFGLALYAVHRARIILGRIAVLHTYMRPIAADRVALSVGLSDIDLDAVLGVGSGGPKEVYALYWGAGHIDATWRTRLNPPSTAAMRPYVKSL